MTSRNPGVKLSGDRNECPGCNELFNSTAAFDKHRTGRFGVPVGMGGRRCMTVPEMLDKGMMKNAGGFWIGSPNPKFAIPSQRTADSSDFPGESHAP